MTTQTSGAVRGVSARVPALVFGLGLLTSLAVVFFAFKAQSLVDTRFDPYYFEAMGKSLVRGEGFLPYGNLLHRRSPLYPLVIAAVYTVFGEHPLLVKLLQALFLAGTCLLVFDMGRRIFNRRTGLIAAVACAVHPMMLRYVADFHLETMLTFLLTLTLWLMVRFQESPTIGRGAAVGAAAALASLTKAVVVLFPGLFAAGTLLAAWRARRRDAAAGAPRRPWAFPWAPFVVMFAVMGAFIAPWTIRNYRVTGHFVPIATGMSDAFLRGFVFSKPEYALLRKPPYTDAENESNAMFRALCRAEGAEWEKDDWQTDRILNRAAKAKLASDPAGFVRKFLVGLATFWYEMTTLRNSLIAGGLALLAWGLAIVGWRRARREGRRVWLLLLPALYLNLLLAALLSLGRYSMPILPGLLVAAAYGVDTLLSSRGREAAHA